MKSRHQPQGFHDGGGRGGAGMAAFAPMFSAAAEDTLKGRVKTAIGYNMIKARRLSHGETVAGQRGGDLGR